MLKITRQSNGERTILELEGRLAGPWVAELRDCWQRAAAGPHPVLVLLSQVTYIDDAGKKLMSEICRSGTEISGEGCMTKAVIEQIKQGGSK